MMRFFDKARPGTEAARPLLEIALALAAKGAMLLALYLLFFGPSHRPRSDAPATAAALLGGPVNKESR